ncbi:YciI family protein [Streptacidiphilus rugosus]|uniref:YciI family protein n=1 Tax=Streptacidiphilus rugosus TaxID=405783 RepID=UPI00056468A7|nr:YciI family protein [Streptacidiphilus rugosus]
MEYALLIYGPEVAWDEMSENEREERFTANRAFGRAMFEAGVRVVYGARLARPDFAEAEPRAGEGVLELGGMWLIDVETEEEARTWADRVPVFGENRVELRRCDGPRRREEN